MVRFFISIICFYLNTILKHLHKAKRCDRIIPTNLETYRSGRNELDSKSSCRFTPARGFESHRLRQSRRGVIGACRLLSNSHLTEPTFCGYDRTKRRAWSLDRLYENKFCVCQERIPPSPPKPSRCDWSLSAPVK